MIEKGISLYPGMGYSLVTSFDYLYLAHQAGFSRLFTSLHIPEADDDNLVAEFQKLTASAVSLGFRVTADISPRSFRLLNIGVKNLKPLRQLGLDALRLDYGFSAADIACWTRQSGLTIELNASTIDASALDAILSAGADPARLQACHNYYPRPETGLSWDLFSERSRLFRQYGIPVAAFIPSSKHPRGPLGEGLPTLEQHRRLDPVIAAKQLVYSGMVDRVLFGDPLAAAVEIQTVGRIQPDCIEMSIQSDDKLSSAEQTILFADHINRLDPGEWVVRSASSRTLQAGVVAPRIPHRRPRGSITIDNANYLRYMGELQIVRKPLDADERVNVVAAVTDPELFLIDMIRPGMRFRFVEKTK